MSEAAATPAPSNGMNGPSPSQPTITSLPPVPKPRLAVDPGPNTNPGQPQRGPDGKFAPTKPVEAKPEAEKKPAPAVDDDPEIDLGDMKLKRSQLKSELGRARSASKLLTEAKREKEEAAKLKAEQDSRKAKYLEDFDAFFEDAGITDRDERARIVSKYLHQKFIAPEQMTAEQKAIAERDARIAAFEAKEKAETEAKQKAEMEQVSQAEEKKLRQQIGSILKAGNIPARPLAVKRVAERIASYEEQGLDVPVEDAARLVRDEMAADTADLLSSASLDDLHALWGQEKFSGIVTRLITEKGVDGLRKAMGHEGFKKVALMFAEYGKSLLSPQAQQMAPRQAAQPAPKPAEYLTPAEFMNRRK
jgi:hypothetical protein